MLNFYHSQTRNRKLLSLFGGFLLHIVIGTVYITGNISIYLASYLQYEGHDVTIDDLSIVLPLQIVGTSSTLLLGSYLTNTFNPWMYFLHRTAIIGNSIVILSVFLTSFIKTYALIVIVYGLLFGMGVGITYTTPLIVSWSHFPEYKGKISGVIISGFGFGSSIFNLVSTHMINPSNDTPHDKIHGNKYFEPHIAKKVPEVLRWLSLIYLILSVIGVLCLTWPTKQDNLSDLVEKNKDEECPSLKEGVKTKRFWHLFFMALMSVIPGLYILNVYKTFGKTKIDNDGFLAIVGSISSIFNGSFRYLWGILMDKLSFKKSYGLLVLTQTGFIMTVYYVAEVPALYLIWVSIIACCEGGHFTLFPTIIARMYGKRMGSKVYGALFFCFSIGGVVGFLLQSYLTSVVGYQILFWVLGFISLITIVPIYYFSEVNLWASKNEDTEIKSFHSES